MVFYKHPLDRAYSCAEDARKVAKNYFENKVIRGFFIVPCNVSGVKMYKIAYYLVDLTEDGFEFEAGD